MKYETRPFIMLNDLEEMYEYSDENMTMLERGHTSTLTLSDLATQSSTLARATTRIFPC